MKKIFVIVFVCLTIGIAADTPFPGEYGFFTMQLPGSWQVTEEGWKGRYWSAEARQGVVAVTFTYASDPEDFEVDEFINEKKILDDFLEDVDRTSYQFSYYKITTFDSYLGEDIEFPAAEGMKTVNGANVYFIARAYFIDFTAVLVTAYVPVEQQDEYEYQLKALLEL